MTKSTKAKSLEAKAKAKAKAKAAKELAKETSHVVGSSHLDGFIDFKELLCPEEVLFD